MRPSSKSKLFWTTAAVLGIAALVLAAFSVFQIKAGGYPPEGTGSLGHVGMVISGIIAGFIAIILGLFMTLCISKARAAARVHDPDSGSGSSTS